MKKTRKSVRPVSAETIARLADQGKDISGFFKGQGRMVQPIQRVNVDPPRPCCRNWIRRLRTSMLAAKP